MLSSTESSQPAAYHIEERYREGQKNWMMAKGCPGFEPCNRVSNTAESRAATTDSSIASSIHYPHLILHFDINQTLLVGDSVQDKSPEMAIIDALTDRFIDQWDENLPKAIDYNTYVKEYLYPNPHKDRKIKSLQKEAVCSFLAFLKESDHRFYPEAQAMYDQAIASCKKRKTVIFTSFYKLLDYLKRNEISYTLIFRTFGTDVNVVFQELNNLLGDRFLTDFVKYKEKEFTDQADFYRYLKTVKRAIVIQDDWATWYQHEENGAYGKAFPMDFEDRNTLSLFFDDNARLNTEHPEKNAIAPFDLRSGKTLTPSEAIKAGNLFPVDTLEALNDSEYFIKLLNIALDANIPQSN